MKNYQGWANYETWNVALDMNNNERIYLMTHDFMLEHGKKPKPFQTFVNDYGLMATIDGVLYTHPDLDIKELDELMTELIEE